MDWMFGEQTAIHLWWPRLISRSVSFISAGQPFNLALGSTHAANGVQMSNLITHLDQRLYPGVDGHWDDKFFREEVLGVLRPDHHVLDLGAGAGIVAEMNFRGLARRVCGVDPDPRVKMNPYLDEAREGTGEAIPYANEAFDIVVADNVLEHLSDPRRVFREVSRVLRPGGLFLAKTPNALHYMPLIARYTPHRFHELVNRLRGRATVDTFPTRYRANSIRTVRKLAMETGFICADMKRLEGRPEYLRMTVPTYVVGWAYERLVNSTPWFAPFRILLILKLVKK